MEKQIEITNLKKSFGKHVILQDINLTISKGQSIAFVGHNGCGKSTLLKILCRLTTYQKGKLEYSQKLKFNYVPENFPKMAITAREYINNIGLIEGLSNEYVKKRSDELFRAFFMEEMVDNSIKNLSKGTMQKVCVIQAVLSKPDILLLDEPLSGQDVDSQKVFIDLINQMNEDGVTIVMSCHEDLLLNAISKTVYEIKNENIYLSDMKEIKDRSYDVMIFRKKKQEMKDAKPDIRIDELKIDECRIEERKIDELNIKELVIKLEKDRIDTKLYVKKDNSDIVLRKMLNQGYELRGMYDENI